MIKIYEAGTVDFNNNGLGAIKPIKCVETKKASLNGWQIDCEVALKYKDMISKDNVILVETKEKGEQPFIMDSPTIDSTITFTAKHVLFLSERYILDDVRPINLSANEFLNYINERTDNKSPFSFNTNVIDVKTKYFVRKTLLEALEETEELFSSAFDVDGYTISMMTSLKKESDLKLAYRNNIEGIKIYENWDTVVTKLMPVGPDGLLLDKKYLYADVSYPQPYTRIVDFSINTQDDDGNEKSEAQLKQELKAEALKYIEQNKNPKINYTVSANPQQNVGIGYVAKVLHPLVSIDVEVQSYEYDTLTKRVTKIEFGNYERDVKKEFSKITAQINETKKATNDFLLKAQKDAKKVIEDFAKVGHRYETENETYFLDTLPKEKAKYVMRMNLGGIAFSKNGVDGDYITAWTIDGKFNADFIATGTLEAIKIKAAEISGGTIDGVEISGSIFKTDKYITLHTPEFGIGGYIDFRDKDTNEQISSIYHNTGQGRHCFFKTNQYLHMQGGEGSFLEVENTGIAVLDGTIEASTEITVSSDKRLKENIQDIELSSIIDDVKVKSYNYINSDKRKVGVIAQSFINNKYEEYILSKDKKGFYSVSYNALLMGCIQKIQELEKRINALNGRR